MSHFYEAMAATGQSRIGKALSHTTPGDLAITTTVAGVALWIPNAIMQVVMAVTPDQFVQWCSAFGTSGLALWVAYVCGQRFWQRSLLQQLLEAAATDRELKEIAAGAAAKEVSGLISDIHGNQLDIARVQVKAAEHDVKLQQIAHRLSDDDTPAYKGPGSNMREPQE